MRSEGNIALTYAGYAIMIGTEGHSKMIGMDKSQ